MHQRLTHRPGLGARQQDQPLAQLAQPGRTAHSLRPPGVLRPATGQQLTQVQIALAVLHQQNDLGHHAGIVAQAFEHHLGANDGFHALAPGFPVELDGPEQVVQVGDGQRGLAILGGGAGGLVDAVGAVNDGKLGMEAKMDKHCGHFKKPNPTTRPPTCNRPAPPPKITG